MDPGRTVEPVDRVRNAGAPLWFRDAADYFGLVRIASGGQGRRGGYVSGVHLAVNPSGPNRIKGF